MRGLFQNIFAVIMWKPCVCEAKSPTAFSTALVRTKQIKQSMAFCIAKAIVCYDPNDQKKSPRNILRSISRHGQLYVCQLRVAWKESIIAQKTTAKFFNAYQSSEINIFQDKSMTTMTVWYLCRMTLTSFLPCSSWILWESNHRFFFFFFKWVNEQVGHLISIAVHLVKKQQSGIAAIGLPLPHRQEPHHQYLWALRTFVSHQCVVLVALKKIQVIHYLFSCTYSQVLWPKSHSQLMMLLMKISTMWWCEFTAAQLSTNRRTVREIIAAWNLHLVKVIHVSKDCAVYTKSFDETLAC